MENPTETPVKEKWYIVAVSGAGVQFEGTREEAQEVLNTLAATIQELYRSHGITYIRKEHAVVRKPEEAQEADGLLSI